MQGIRNGPVLWTSASETILVKTMQLVDQLETDLSVNALQALQENLVNLTLMNVLRIHVEMEQNASTASEDTVASVLLVSMANSVSNMLDSVSRILVELEETVLNSTRVILATVILDLLAEIVKPKLLCVSVRMKNTNAPSLMGKHLADVLKGLKVKTVTNLLIFVLIKIHV